MPIPQKVLLAKPTFLIEPINTTTTISSPLRTTKPFHKSHKSIKPSPCTKRLLGGDINFNLSPTCTTWEAITTETSYIDCQGCALETVLLGLGPVKTCNTTITRGTKTERVTLCAGETEMGTSVGRERKGAVTPRVEAVATTSRAEITTSRQEGGREGRGTWSEGIGAMLEE
jgi:hypothetical protein